MPVISHVVARGRQKTFPNGHRFVLTVAGYRYGAIIFDDTADPPSFSGISISQDFPATDPNTVYALSWWLKADSLYHNTAGCTLSVYTAAPDQEFDLSDLDELEWSQYIIRDIQGEASDSFSMLFSGCEATRHPKIFIDDIFYGVDTSVLSNLPGIKSTSNVSPSTTTGTAAACTTTPEIQDPDFESDGSAWQVQSYGSYDDSFDISNAYKPPSGRSVGVFTLPDSQNSIYILQPVTGICTGEAYIISIWFNVPSPYDPSICRFSLTISDSQASLDGLPAVGTWTQLTTTFFAEDDEYGNQISIQPEVTCRNENSMVVLLDDITFTKPRECTVVTTISDSSFESGNLTIWRFEGMNGDEKFEINTTQYHTGARSAKLTFPSIHNSASISRDWQSCIGSKLTTGIWVLLPSTYSGNSCVITILPTQDGSGTDYDIVADGTWRKYSVNFTAKKAEGTGLITIACQNELKLVELYLDDYFVEVV